MGVIKLNYTSKAVNSKEDKKTVETEYSRIYGQKTDEQRSVTEGKLTTDQFKRHTAENMASQLNSSQSLGIYSMNFSKKGYEAIMSGKGQDNSILNLFKESLNSLTNSNNSNGIFDYIDTKEGLDTEWWCRPKKDDGSRKKDGYWEKRIKKRKELDKILKIQHEKRRLLMKFYEKKDLIKADNTEKINEYIDNKNLNEKSLEKKYSFTLKA